MGRFSKMVWIGRFSILCALLLVHRFVNMSIHAEIYGDTDTGRMLKDPRTEEKSHNMSFAAKGEAKYRILCWILTDPDDLDNRTIHVKNTWTQKCDIRLFMSSAENKTFPTIGLNVSSGRQHIAAKSKAAWTYIHNNFAEQADYFMKADPDTYVIVENLRKYLSHRDPTVAEYIGHSLKLKRHNFTYMSGGSGIVISREALRLLVTKAFPLRPTCIPDGEDEGEDWKTAQCLSKVGAKAVNTSDGFGRERFLLYRPEIHILGLYPPWFYEKNQNIAKQGINCCSDFPIAFHYINPLEMYVFDYLLNRVQVMRTN
ncbi:glycoprotein-N-acetylgalactosamine 3-beta-galactosyltransferase 1-like [Lingula anatina]|uniref:N-acetylgalactosaminide beta-1,3-galactosyltransferase n=1 Tax=Lingula anatina TaxID=7574 RepID=A0A2R2MQB4_LINAN|nr:glycoprotein-N-acetylgalactosamine 3-beta-galactosyltransferase 1-like [Lingula anatina]|eukprot:XP_023932353.1 glycoprotein-N-acetylgalactosamine 3-beta-galactosyltransferase 1-like [Lingula anatina]